MNINYNPAGNLYEQNKCLTPMQKVISSQKLPYFTANKNLLEVITPGKSLILTKFRQWAGKLANAAEKKGIPQKVCPFEVCPLREFAQGETPKFKIKLGKFPKLDKIISFFKSL